MGIPVKKNNVKNMKSLTWKVYLLGNSEFMCVFYLFFFADLIIYIYDMEISVKIFFNRKGLTWK